MTDKDDEEAKKAKAKAKAEPETSEDDAEEEASESDDAEKEGDDEEEEEKSASDDEEEKDDEEDADDDDATERDASTRGVAKALGVDEDEPEGEEEGKAGEEASTVQNRAARRRAEAEKRRQTRMAKRRKDDEDDGAVAARDALPKDKNARAKELLKRRQEAAEGKGRIGLSAGEVVQDQLARAASGTGRWFQTHFKKIVGVAAVGIAATVGALYYLDYDKAAIGRVSDDLARGYDADQGAVMKEDKRTDQQKEADPTPVFTSSTARADAQLDAFGKVVAARPGSGLALLATLGQAGAYLDKGEADKALAACDEILKSELAKADVDVKARALELKGFALESKKDFDGAMAVFKELEGADKAFEDLGRYHQARMNLAKGEKDKAKEIFSALVKKLELPTLEGPQQSALKAQADEYLRELDPTHAPPKRGFGGPKATPSLEELMNAQRELQKKAPSEQHGDDEGDEGGDELPMPMPKPGGN